MRRLRPLLVGQVLGDELSHHAPVNILKGHVLPGVGEELVAGGVEVVEGGQGHGLARVPLVLVEEVLQRGADAHGGLVPARSLPNACPLLYLLGLNQDGFPDCVLCMAIIGSLEIGSHLKGLLHRPADFSQSLCLLQPDLSQAQVTQLAGLGMAALASQPLPDFLPVGLARAGVGTPNQDFRGRHTE